MKKIYKVYDELKAVRLIKDVQFFDISLVRNSDCFWGFSNSDFTIDVDFRFNTTEPVEIMPSQ